MTELTVTLVSPAVTVADVVACGDTLFTSGASVVLVSWRATATVMPPELSLLLGAAAAGEAAPAWR